MLQAQAGRNHGCLDVTLEACRSRLLGAHEEDFSPLRFLVGEFANFDEIPQRRRDDWPHEVGEHEVERPFNVARRPLWIRLLRTSPDGGDIARRLIAICTRCHFRAPLAGHASPVNALLVAVL